MRFPSWRIGLAVQVLGLSSGLLAGGCTCYSKPPWNPPGGEKLPVLESIEVDDPLEAALLQQELGLKPFRVIGRTLYYEDTGLTERLIGLGYRPARAVPEAVIERVVRVNRRKKADAKDELALREAGAEIILRERSYWVIRASLERLRLLGRLGFQLEDLRGREPRPRQVLVQVATLDQVGAVARAGVDIYTVAPAASDDYAQRPRGYLVYGGAFDSAVDALREQGFSVTIQPDPPGVIR